MGRPSVMVVNSDGHGHACAVEFIADGEVRFKLPPQAGLAAHELAGPDKLQAARIYDDVTPPFE